MAKLRALFPDYHSGFKDLIIDVTADNDDDTKDRSEEGSAGVDARVKALGLMSDKQLSSVVARHCRIFLSLSARRRGAVRALLASSSPRRDGSHPAPRSVEAAKPQARCCDPERLVAFEDSYRASVLLAGPTSRLPSSVVFRPSPRPGGEGETAATVLQVEEAFSASHLLALADAARLCRSGRSLLEDAAGVSFDEATTTTAGAATLKKTKKDKARASLGGVSDAPWLGEGAAGRNLLLVDPLVSFHLDPNVGETRLADGSLVAMLRRVAGLLEEFPGHGVLIQVSVDIRVYSFRSSVCQTPKVSSHDPGLCWVYTILILCFLRKCVCPVVFMVRLD